MLSASLLYYQFKKVQYTLTLQLKYQLNRVLHCCGKPKEAPETPDGSDDDDANAQMIASFQTAKVGALISLSSKLLYSQALAIVVGVWSPLLLLLAALMPAVSVMSLLITEEHNHMLLLKAQERTSVGSKNDPQLPFYHLLTHMLTNSKVLSNLMVPLPNKLLKFSAILVWISITLVVLDFTFAIGSSVCWYLLSVACYVGIRFYLTSIDRRHAEVREHSSVVLEVNPAVDVEADKRIVMDVVPSTSVRSMITVLAQQLALQTAQLELSHGGHVLDPGKKLKDYVKASEQTLQLEIMAQRPSKQEEMQLIVEAEHEEMLATETSGNASLGRLDKKSELGMAEFGQSGIHRKQGKKNKPRKRGRLPTTPSQSPGIVQPRILNI